MLCLEAPQRSPPEMDSAILAAILPRSMTACGPARNVLGLRLQRDRFHRLLDAGRILHDSGAPLTRDHPVVARIDALLDGQLSANLDRLDTLEISDTPPMSTFKELLAGHGLQVARYGKDPFWEALSNMARSASRRTWEARVQVEAIEATRKGWFVVFDTITYDPNEFTDEVMYGPHWKRYLRAVQHSVVRSIYGSLASFRRSGDSFADSIRYFAVPEAHKDGRTHLHILWFLKDLPDCSSRSCPNQHRAQPTRREVSGWPQYPYGRICKRLAVRYTGDAFTRRLAWRWPVDAKTRQRIPARPVIAIARYMAKYLSKPRPETLKCRRIRTSPALGLGPIRQNPVNSHQQPVGGPVYDSSATQPQPSPSPMGHPYPGQPPEAPGPEGATPPISPPEPTDEELVAAARDRWGHNFSPSAAKAFLNFDPESRDVQPAEFYRFSDAELDRWGYF